MNLVDAKGWLRWLKFEHGQRVTHRRSATSTLRALEASDGQPLPPSIKRPARDYAGDVLGSPRFAPWLCVYVKIRGSFVAVWISVDFFDHIVIRRVNRVMRGVGRTKPSSERCSQTPPFPTSAT